MSLDYSQGCVNFRDVGEFINLIANEDILPTGRLFRGGKIDFVNNLKEIGTVATIMNLRKGADRFLFDVRYLHFPISNRFEKYETTQKEVRTWLNQVIGAFEDPEFEYPVLLHCTSGKDRTGVAVAALLSILRVPRPVIVEEYLLSDGEVKAEWIEGALNGFQNVEQYFHRLDLEQIRRHVLGV